MARTIVLKKAVLPAEVAAALTAEQAALVEDSMSREMVQNVIDFLKATPIVTAAGNGGVYEILGRMLETGEFSTVYK